MIKRVLSALLVVSLLAIPIIAPDSPASSRATLNDPGQGFWGGAACGAALGAVVVGGGILAAGTIGLGAAFALSLGAHVMVVCALV
jgi:hypothetical protein